MFKNNGKSHKSTSKPTSKSTSKTTAKPTKYIMVTGHRPPELGGYDKDNDIQKYIKSQLTYILEACKNRYNIIGISGGALGADQIWMDVCLETGTPYYLYAPFLGQESMWPEPSQKKYKQYINSATKYVIVSDGNYSPNKMQIRNERMVDDADLCIAIWNGKTHGGTYNCLQYIDKLNKKKICVNPNDYKQ